MLILCVSPFIFSRSHSKKASGKPRGNVTCRKIEQQWVEEWRFLSWMNWHLMGCRTRCLDASTIFWELGTIGFSLSIHGTQWRLNKRTSNFRSLEIGHSVYKDSRTVHIHILKFQKQSPNLTLLFIWSPILQGISKTWNLRTKFISFNCLLLIHLWMYELSSRVWSETLHQMMNN